jgi:signal transduction histidine kinase
VRPACQTLGMLTDRPDRAADEILRGLDHDLRNPVANILGFVDLLRDSPGPALSADQLELLTRIEENCQTLLAMLQRLAGAAKRRT